MKNKDDTMLSLFLSLRLFFPLYLKRVTCDLLVTRVVNTYGPQTRGGGGHGAAGEQQRGPLTRDCGNAAIEERLQNMETHLRLSEGQRLKKKNSIIVCVCVCVCA